MPTYIKTGFWEKTKKGYKDWLNLDQLIQTVNSFLSPISFLSDSPSINLSSANNTLTTSSATKTFTISYEGDEINVEVVLNTATSTFTFPVNSLCVIDGVSTGNNAMLLSGVSGDKYIIGIKNLNNTYYIICKNFGQ